MKKYKYTKTFTYGYKRYYIRGNTLQEVGEKKQKKIQELEKKHPKDSEMTVADWVPRCIEAYKVRQSEATRKEYTRAINKTIVKEIGYRKLVNVTPMLCQEVLNLQSGKSKSQINLVYNGLRFIFSHALDNGLILENPTLKLVKPQGTYHPRRALTPLEREAVLDVASRERKYYCFLLMLLCGCRPSEACECKGSDISLQDSVPVLHIRGTKTKSADRFVPIPEHLYQLIKKTPKNEYISVYPSGKPIHDKSNRRKLWLGLWYKMNIAVGTETIRNHLLEPYLIPKDLTPYCLRHEYCSELARKGIDIRIAQKLMGHSNITMTANIYTHIEDTLAITKVAKMMNE